MDLVFLLNHFPALSETFVVDEVQTLRSLGHEVRVESGARADPAAVVADPPQTNQFTEDGLRRRLADLIWLTARHPGGVLSDLLNRRRWAREEVVRPLRVLAPVARRLARHGEQHIHVHFAHVAALDALRLSRLTGVRYSVIAHAFDIFRTPTNLAEKLDGAAVAFGPCVAAVEELRRVAPGARVELHYMTTDPKRFARTLPQPGGRTVIAVGRLVEKKGFVHLVAAAAELRQRGWPLDAVRIVGQGPLHAALAAQIAALELEDTVELLGARDPAEVPTLIESADLLVMPCVIAADGDRDATPLVVQEALAIEVPVVASDLMGLPEVVHPDWGRLVPPGDAIALADAIADVLDRPPAERAAMGRAGRAFVIAERDTTDWARRLAGVLGGLR